MQHNIAHAMCFKICFTSIMYDKWYSSKFLACGVLYMYGLFFSILYVHMFPLPFQINLVFLVLAVVQLCKSQKFSSVRETSNRRVAL